AAFVWRVRSGAFSVDGEPTTLVRLCGRPPGGNGNHGMLAGSQSSSDRSVYVLHEGTFATRLSHAGPWIVAPRALRPGPVLAPSDSASGRLALGRHLLVSAEERLGLVGTIASPGARFAVDDSIRRLA